MPNSEATLNRNKCTNNCLVCPVCSTGLQYEPKEGGAEGDLSLSCSFCQWHSSSVELSGTKAAILQAVKDRQAGESDKQLAELMKFEQQRAKEESQKKELAKQSKSQAFYRKGGRFSKFNFAKAPQMTNRGKTLENLRDRQNKRYNEARHEWVDETCAREYIAPTITAADMVSGAAKDAGLEAALAIKDFSQVSTLGQRYLDLGQQGAATAELWPSFTNLVAKRSKRCRECQHNLIKPELNPTSIKFKMQLFASQHVPTLKIATVPELLVGEQADVVLCISNPLDQPLTITVGVLDEVAAAAAAKVAAAAEKEQGKGAEAEAGAGAAAEGESTATATAGDGADGGAAATASDGEGGAASKGKETDAAVKPDAAAAAAGAGEKETEKAKGKDASPKPLSPVCSTVSKQNQLVGTADVVVPGEDLIVAEHDPVQDYGMNDAAESKYTDNPDIVVKRSGNSLYFKLPVTPKQAGEVGVALTLTYSYSATMPGLSRSAEKTPGKVTHAVVLPTYTILGNARDTDEEL